MTITEMLGQSGLLTLLGMAVVFAFLIIMVLCMNLLQVIVHALKLDTDEPMKTVPAKVPPVSAPNATAAVAAIAAALRNKK